jgi:cysteine desulfurase
MSKPLAPIYLDYAAATPLDPLVEEAMQPYVRGMFYNPSALYKGGRDAKTALETARQSVASAIGARPSEVTFTAGGTESANLAINGVMANYPNASLIVSAVEHAAVLEPARQYTRLKVAPVDKTGRIEVNELSQLIDDDTVLISVMYANNEVGTVQPIEDIALEISKIRADRKERGCMMPLWLHTDACQAPQYLELSVAKTGVDMMTLNGGKIFGPKQSGILYHRTGVNIAPVIRGGGQEHGLRSGTENVANCVGFAKALNLVLANRKEVTNHMRTLSESFKSAIQTKFPDAIFNGHAKRHLPSVIHVTFRGRDNERVLFALDDAGVYAASGSACSASSDEASHVLLAMGISEEDARSSIRFSLGKYTTADELERAVSALEHALDA